MRPHTEVFIPPKSVNTHTKKHKYQYHFNLL